MYVCESCGTIFDEPYIRRWKESHGDGMIEDWAEEVCPACFSDGFEEIEDAETDSL